jgi:hypothetical protein
MVKLRGKKLIAARVFYAILENVKGISEFRIGQEKGVEIRVT